MNIVILNTSPKRKGGASRFFSKILKLLLLGNKVTMADVRGKGDYEKALSLLPEADVVLISSPLYVDGIPAHMLDFLTEAERLCAQGVCHFTLYVMSNSGFIEGRQNALHIKMYQAWCRRANMAWGGGLGIGGGVMLHVLFVLFPILVAVRLVQVLLVVVQAGVISGAEIWAHCSGLLVTPFFFIVPLISMMALAGRAARKKQMKNIYVRPLLPSFVFLIFADIFMLLSALLKGTLPHRLFKKIDLAAVETSGLQNAGKEIVE